MLEVKDIHKSFGNLNVLNGVSFNMDKGETKVIIGPSGTGKSTLLRCINQLTPPDKGQVWLEGEEITDKSKDINQIRQKIGFVFQEFNLFNHLTALRNVSIGLEKIRKIDKEKARCRALEELKRVGLENQANQYPAQLSGGQKQRIFVTKALVRNPEILIMDEPVTGVDADTQERFYKKLSNLNIDKGITILIVSHDLAAVFCRMSKVMCVNRAVNVSPITEDFDPNKALRKAYGDHFHFVFHKHECERIFDDE